MSTEINSILSTETHFQKITNERTDSKKRFPLKTCIIK